MQGEARELALKGLYEKAISASRRQSIDLLKQDRRGDAALSLAWGGELLCSLHQAAKARSFSQEAADLAAKASNATAAGYANAVGALSYLRLGEIQKAQESLDKAVELTAKEPESEWTGRVKLIGAELSLAGEDYAEALAFAEDAYAAGAAADDSVLKARALLVRAICSDRQEQYPKALEFFASAESELLRRRDVETLWQLKGAMANTLEKAGRMKEAGPHRQVAGDLVHAVSKELSPEIREKFLKSPAVRSAVGSEPGSATGIHRMPMQVSGGGKAGQKPIDEKSLATLRPIFEVIKKINSELNLRKLITTILDTMIEYCNAQRGTLVVFEGDRFKIEVARSREKTDLKRFEMGISKTVLRVVREKGRKIVADDAQQDAELKLVDSVQEQQLLSLLCLPLRVKLKLVGAVYLDNPFVVGAFGPREQEIAEILTDHAAVAVDNALLHLQAIQDGLTRLFNHSHFEKRLEAEVSRCKRHKRPCGLLMIDVDNFKSVNDTLGHDAGNEVLRTVANLLAAAVRTDDIVARIPERVLTPVVARYGGDEFEIILPESDREGIEKVAKRILQAMQTTKLAYQGTPITGISFSIGGASFPEDAGDSRELILKADEALYAAKRGGKNRYAAFSAAPAGS